jgi:hypothetical protein
MSVQRDKDYEFVPPIKYDTLGQTAPKGRQCGECGMKFDYIANYGYACGSPRCPMGYGGVNWYPKR